MKSQLPVLALLAALSAPTLATAADVANGKKLALRWCSACHVVSPDQTRAQADVPTFENIARRYDSARLTRFLAAPYPRMPDMGLSRNEIADLVAYIRSLAPSRTRGPAPVEKDTPPPEPRRG